MLSAMGVFSQGRTFPPKPMMHIPPISTKFINAPYFRKICKIPLYFRSIYVFWLNLRSFYFPLFASGLHVLDAPVFSALRFDNHHSSKIMQYYYFLKVILKYHHIQWKTPLINLNHPQFFPGQERPVRVKHDA